MSSTELIVNWLRPTQPNGVILEYRLHRYDANTDRWSVVYTGSAISYSETALSPGLTYQYVIEVSDYS